MTENKLKVAVMFGGRSPEYAVSLHSCASVLRSISEDKYHILKIGITEKGKWLYYDGSIDEIDNNTWFNHDSCCEILMNTDSTNNGFVKLNNNGTFEKISVDVIFPVLHGENGEDGTVQGMCELANIPFVGCGMTSSAVCMDKEYTHAICEQAGIKTAPYMAVVEYEVEDYKKLYDEAVEKLGLPIFIKPANLGSSHGISKIRNYDEFVEGMKYGFKYDKKQILEKTINGFEIGCAILGEANMKIGEVDEIEMDHDFFDYEEKYNQTSTKIHLPARLSPEMTEKAKNMAFKTYRALRCKGLNRIDMFVSTDDGEIYLNETNTIPGFTSLSRFPSMIRVGLNMEFPELIDELIQLAIRK